MRRLHFAEDTCKTAANLWYVSILAICGRMVHPLPLPLLISIFYASAIYLPHSYLAFPVGGEWVELTDGPYEIEKGADFRDFVRYKHGHWNRAVMKKENFS